MSIKSKNWPGETFFLPKTRFLPKTFLSKTKICQRQKYPKMEYLSKTKDPRLIADFLLIILVAGEGVSSKMITIGYFGVIKGLT